MKLRLSENAIRLRVGRSEVKQFGGAGYLEQSITFSLGQRIFFALEASPTASVMNASFDSGRIRIVVPAILAREWADTDRVAIESGGSPLILVEKDFQCLHEAGESDPDAYPNPVAGELPEGG